MVKFYPRICDNTFANFTSTALLLCFHLGQLLVSPTYAQQQTITDNANSGSSQRFSLSINQTHGVSATATMTPDMMVKTTAILNVDSGSFTSQDSNTGTSASMTPNSMGTNGLSGSTTVRYGNGTTYSVEIGPRTYTEPSGNEVPILLENVRSVSTATGQSSGFTNTTITVDSTNTSFMNSFIDNINR